MSWRSNWRARSDRRWAMFSSRPVMKLSTQRTAWSSRMKRSHRWEPIKPAPPVTRMRIADPRRRVLRRVAERRRSRADGRGDFRPAQRLDPPVLVGHALDIAFVLQRGEPVENRLVGGDLAAKLDLADQRRLPVLGEIALNEPQHRVLL